jgi:peptidoglycan/LPS O-acetylase OafA/YrhL
MMPRSSASQLPNVGRAENGTSLDVPPRLRAPTDLPTLTMLRGYAALAVVLFHMADRAAPTPILHNPIIAHSYLGVDLFFVLSGFILAHVYGPQWASGQFSMAAFLQNRLARIYPLHAVMTVVALCWTLTLWTAGGLNVQTVANQLGSDPTVQGVMPVLVTHLALLHAWGTVSSLALNTVSWSVSAEWFAYLLFPMLAAVLFTRGGLWMKLAACVISLILADQVSRLWLERPLTDLTYAFGAFRILPEFALGMVTAMAVAQGALTRLPNRPWIALLFVTLAGIVIAEAPTVVVPVIFAAVIAVLAERDHRAASALLQPWQHRLRGSLVELGTISYALYLVHPLVSKLCFQLLARLSGFDAQSVPLWSVALALFACLSAAWLATYAIEHPARRLLRDLSWPSLKKPHARLERRA